MWNEDEYTELHWMEYLESDWDREAEAPKPRTEAELLQQMAVAAIAPDIDGERPIAFYEAVESLAVFYVRAERLDDARPYWERLWADYPASCWTDESFEKFAYFWFYYDGRDPENSYPDGDHDRIE